MSFFEGLFGDYFSYNSIFSWDFPYFVQGLFQSHMLQTCCMWERANNRCYKVISVTPHENQCWRLLRRSRSAYTQSSSRSLRILLGSPGCCSHIGIYSLTVCIWKLGLHNVILFWSSKAPVAQQVTKHSVNPWIVGSNPSSAIILCNIWQKSMWQAPFVFK